MKPKNTVKRSDSIKPRKSIVKKKKTKKEKPTDEIVPVDGLEKVTPESQPIEENDNNENLNPNHSAEKLDRRHSSVPSINVAKDNLK